jgi:hypothetical protein
MTRWSLAEDRRLIEIAASAKSFDEVVKRTGRSPRTIRRTAWRLGIKLGKQISSDNQLAAELKVKPR